MREQTITWFSKSERLPDVDKRKLFINSFYHIGWFEKGQFMYEYDDGYDTVTRIFGLIYVKEWAYLS